jgi:hypothetical protein
MSEHVPVTTSSLVGQNPLVFMILLLVLGGQGVDVFSSQVGNNEFRELRTDVESALQEITDNSERISRAEGRIDSLADTLHDIERADLRDYESLRRVVLQLDSRLQTMASEAVTTSEINY